MKYSAVIASVGEETLSCCISSLLRSYLPPDELIIVFPESLRHIYAIFPLPRGCIVYYSKSAGQTTQRLLGIKKASNLIILQSDSSIIFAHETSLSLMMAHLHLGELSVISPITKALDKNKYKSKFFEISECHGKINFLPSALHSTPPFDFFYWFGFPRSPYRSTSSKYNLYLTNWVNGILLTSKRNLLLYNHYPFQGKAFSEDLINSFYLRTQRSCSLWICCSAESFSLFRPEYISFLDFVVYIFCFIRAKAYFSYKVNPLLVLPSITIGIILAIKMFCFRALVK